MSDVKLGSLIKAGLSRDAIHVAVAPVMASEDLIPGQPIAVRRNTDLAGPSTRPMGIVDPFLTTPVKKGQWFWMVMFPNTVENLRHEWDHPDMASAEDRYADSYDDGCRGC